MYCEIVSLQCEDEKDNSKLKRHQCVPDSMEDDVVTIFGEKG